MATNDSYVIREAQADEQTEIISFLEQYYFPFESVNRMYLNKNSHRVDEQEKKYIADDVRSIYTIIVPKVPCLVAIHKEINKIAGLTLMLVTENRKFTNGNSISSADKNCAVEISTVTELPVPFQSKLLDEIGTYIVTAAYNSVDLFSQFRSHSTALKLTFLCVDPKHYRRNLATRLVQEAVKYAENKGIGFVYGLCSSPFSRKVTEKNGFKNFSDFDVVKCRDGDGNLMLDGEEPYIISVMAKETKRT